MAAEDDIGLLLRGPVEESQLKHLPHRGRGRGHILLSDVIWDQFRLRGARLTRDSATQPHVSLSGGAVAAGTWRGCLPCKVDARPQDGLCTNYRIYPVIVYSAAIVVYRSEGARG